MAPSHLLRATMPIRSITSPIALARSTIGPSTSLLSQTIRSASMTSQNTSQRSARQPKVTAQTSNELLPPAPLREYGYTLKTGTVQSVGRMDRTVSVIHRHNTWDKRIRKFYPKEARYLVSDPRNSLREGDVIEFSSGAPKSRHVHHVVNRIITPFAVPIEDRPAVMSREERQAERERRWAEKYLRKESRRLGEEIDLAARVKSALDIETEGVPAAELIHRLFAGKERVGKVKQLVRERLSGDQA
ncbi:uncharacterized protein N7459_010033 [Penicillium hispanicum]|uniref:uncharacterized protein n=1 Tax=Penicillium hispanicum TaxID=1080232 RepID=UPI002540A4D1|nr:uncharacterized protein N7459_010033 [Penicillium hispanicum]KAJ5570603.1 hypothetical protein N7459_010033 [Penicillium hispanicum]